MSARLFFVFSLLVLGTAWTCADAATFVVDNLADANDASPGNGVCDNGDGTCSFRAAVQEANALAGPDRIELVAGTHVLSITRFVSGRRTLAKIFLQSEIEVVGAGTGQTIIFSDKRTVNGVMDVFLNKGNELVAFRDLTFDLQTGGILFIYIGVGYAPDFTAFLLEDVELLANSFVPSRPNGAGRLITTGVSGAVVLRRAFVQSQRRARGGALIDMTHNGNFVIEDSIFDGGNQYQIAAAQFFRGDEGGPIIVRDSIFRNFRSFGGGNARNAVFFLNLFALSDRIGELTIERSTFESSLGAVNIINRGFQADVTITDTLFDGVSNAVRVSGPATGSITNSTISGGGTGIALVTPEAGSGLVDLTLDSSTITGAGTSISAPAALGTLTARNSIIANAITAECVGTLTSAGHNLVEGACTIAGDTTGNVTGVDPQLAPLADNGGPTRTHALIAGSPAIDSGDEPNCPATDQRGFSRPADGDGDSTANCDMGAFEKDAVLVTNLPPTANDDQPAVNEDTAATTLDVASNDTDPDGNLDPTTTKTDCGTCSTPSNGGLVNNGNGTFDYTPAADFFGADSFVYEICDTDGACDTAIVDITVNPVNDPPSFVAGADPTFPAGTSGVQSIANWPQNIDLGPNEVQRVDSYAVTTLSDPAGILSGAAAIGISGELSFSLSGASGTAQMNATLTDDGGTANGGSDTSRPVAFSITVEPPSADLTASILRCTTKAAPGGPFPYGLRITNAGPNSAEGVALTHTPISGATVTSISSGACVDNGASVDCDLGTLAPGADVRIGLEIQAPNTGAQTLTMDVEVLAATADPDLADNQDQNTVEILPGLVIADGFESCGPD